jgi:hypothetical protein
MDLGPDRLLNEIVIAGSHDAGITTGKKNEQTQVLPILEQARAGVRFFDIRVSLFDTGVKVGGVKQLELKSFHADDMLIKKSKVEGNVAGFTGLDTIKQSSMRMGLGTQGMGLLEMLQDAKQFVESVDGNGEFLILKFDKCTNWEHIAELCRTTLGACIYSKGGNLNTKRLRDLSGKVIIAFMTKGYTELKRPGANKNIVHIKNLYKPPAGYDVNFHGLQYWGAGGTGINNKDYDEKLRENMKKQRKIMLAGLRDGVKDKRLGLTDGFKKIPGCSSANPNAIGMMYWTTTGLRKSILDRDANMWSDNNKPGLTSLFSSGFDVFMGDALPKNIPLKMSSGGTLKMFMPNIVMIDFADETKCKTIYDLNDFATAKLVEVCQKMGLG